MFQSFYWIPWAVVSYGNYCTLGELTSQSVLDMSANKSERAGQASESKTSPNKRKVTVYTRDTYDRVQTVTQSSSTPTALKQAPAFKDDQPRSPILNPQVHNVKTTVDNKIVDGQYVRTEKQVETAMKENYKQQVEEIKQ